MQRLDPAVEYLGKTGDLFHRCHRNSLVGNGFRGRSGRDDIDTGGVQAAGELDEPGLVVHADQCAADRPSPRVLPVVATHPIVAFRPIQVTPPVATAAITSTNNRRSV